jgi:hypothetical protein
MKEKWRKQSHFLVAIKNEEKPDRHQENFGQRNKTR